MYLAKGNIGGNIGGDIGGPTCTKVILLANTNTKLLHAFTRRLARAHMYLGKGNIGGNYSNDSIAKWWNSQDSEMVIFQS